MKDFIRITLLFWCINLYSQSSTFKVKTGNMEWQLNDVLPTTNGGKLMLGGYDSLSIALADNNNNILWAKSIYSGMEIFDIDLVEKNSNYYMSYQNRGSTSIIVMKFSGSGQLLFSKSIFYPNVNWLPPNNKSSFSVNASDEVIISSSFEGFMTLHKLDSSGNLVYGYKINADTMDATGVNHGYSSAICNDGGIMNTGSIDSGAVIVKLNQSGVFQWAKSFNVSTFNNCQPRQIIKSIDGNFIVSGYSVDVQNGTGQFPFLMKIDSVGDIKWYREYTLSNFSENSLNRLIELANGNIISYFQNTSMLIETDNMGNVLLRRLIPNDCKNIHSYLNSIYMTSYDRSTVSLNSISTINCSFLDSIGFNSTTTITSNSLTLNTYSKITSYGTLYNIPISLNNTHLSIEQICGIVGIENISFENTIKIYPNPTTSILNIEDKQNSLEKATLVIENSLGEIVFSDNFKPAINISVFSNGIYFLTIKGTTSNKTVKIIKQ